MALYTHVLAIIMLVVCSGLRRECNCKGCNWKCRKRDSSKSKEHTIALRVTSTVPMGATVTMPREKTALKGIPSAVSGLMATRISCLTVLLMWNPSVPPQVNVSYTVQRQDGKAEWKSIAEDWRSTRFQYTITEPGTDSFRIRACQEGQCSQYKSTTVSYTKTDPSLVPLVTVFRQTIIDSQSVLLQWSYPVSDASFLIEGHFSNEWIVQGTTTNTSLMVAREMNLNQYRVSATSWCGESPPAVFPLLNASSLAPVSNVTVMRLSPCNKSAELHWSNTNENDENIAFKIEVLEPGSEWKIVTENLTATTLRYNLKQNGEYRFRVKRVHTPDGRTSQPVTVIKNFSNTEPIVKNFKLAFATSISVWLSWAVEIGESTDVTVEVGFRTAIWHRWTVINSTNISQSKDMTQQKDHLLAGYGYRFRVIAHSRCGDSNQVQSREFIAGYSVPRGPPPDFTVRNSAPGVVMLSWSVPGYDDLTDYIYYVTYNVSRTQVKQINNGIAQTLSVKGLANYTVYKFTIRAELSGFTSTGRSVTILTLPQTTPKPYGLLLVSRGLTWFRLQWDILGDDIADGYVVCYRWVQVTNTEEMRSHCQVVPDNTHSVNVSGLNHCTVYPVNVTCTSTRFPTLAFQSSPVTRFQTAVTAPTSLVQLDCKPASPTSLHLNWTESNTTDCPVEEYLVQYAVNDSITLKSSLKATVDEGYQLGDLRPWTTYTVWVTPLNNGGPGLKSNVVHCKTEQSVPSAGPVITNVTSTSDSITATWKALSERQANGIVQGYRLRALAAFHFPLRRNVSATNGTTLTWTFKGLHPFTEFNISVAAYTERGEGPASYTVVTTQQAVPSAPRDVLVSQVLSRSLYVHWKPPLIEEQNGVIIAYITIALRIGENPTTQSGIKEIITPAFSRSTMVTNLSPYTQYLIYVRASTVTGIGAPSQTILVRTKQDFPNCPTSLEARAVSPTAVKLEWSHPTEPNGLLTGYTIKLVADTGEVQIQKVASTAKSDHIDQLTPDMNYVLRVDADNIVGRSSNCMNVTFKTLSDRAEPPSNFSVIALGPNTIVATWAEPHHFGHLIGYNVVYFIMGYNNSSVTVSVTSGQSMVIINDLSPWTTFNLTILAITKDSMHGTMTEGIPAPYQLVTTPGTKWNTEAPGEEELHWWVWIAGAVPFIIVLSLVCYQLKKHKSATGLAANKEVRQSKPNGSDQTQDEALPMTTIQRAGSFDIVPIDDSSRSTTGISCNQDDLGEDGRCEQAHSWRRNFDYLYDISSDNSTQASPITVRVQLHTSAAVDAHVDRPTD